jgi:ubiquinol-cytochrome c reductase cytochrome c1 subunit
MKRQIALLLALLLAPSLAAASGGAALDHSHANVHDRASVQSGAKLFMNYCVSCHSVRFMRYSRMAQDLDLSEEQVMKHLNFTGAKFGEAITVAMDPEDAKAWFGAPPPDLSLTARSRGPDWIYTYLRSFYVDDTRPIGWNNTILPGASMPHVLWELQGTQRAVTEPKHTGKDGRAEPCHKAEVNGECFVRFELASPGKLGREQYDEAVRDLVSFMTYVGEPAALQRGKFGVWVIVFLVVFTFLAWLVKHEYWREVH